jgi:hypothetical protein
VDGTPELDAQYEDAAKWIFHSATIANIGKSNNMIGLWRKWA